MRSTHSRLTSSSGESVSSLEVRTYQKKNNRRQGRSFRTRSFSQRISTACASRHERYTGALIKKKNPRKLQGGKEFRGTSHNRGKKGKHHHRWRHKLHPFSKKKPSTHLYKRLGAYPRPSKEIKTKGMGGKGASEGARKKKAQKAAGIELNGWGPRSNRYIIGLLPR